MVAKTARLRNCPINRRPMPQRFLWFCFLVAGLAAMVLPQSDADALTVNVVDADGNAVAVSCRWLLEEDATHTVVPGVFDPEPLAVRMHRSYMPVVASGRSSGGSVSIDVPADKRYFVSILPESGYSNSGTSVAVGQSEATVIVSSVPLPTAQISIFVFEDNMPINNAPDLPGERGLEGFKIVLYEAGGTFGMSGGQAMMDIFGNMVGSTYDADGNLMTMGNGYVISDANGEAVIQNLSEGKFTIQVVPPAGEGWVQTSTIEGTKGNDAWVKPNEPSFFAEFGPPGYHTFYGFTKAINDASALTGDRNITGNVVNLHNSRPPEYTFHAGEPVPNAWVGLNDISVGRGRGIFAAPCDESGSFIIPNVPPGNYQLVVWDEALDVIFAFHTVAVTADADVDLGPIPVFNWFARLDNYVFNDTNENGFWDTGEQPIPEQLCNIRFRDGSIYQSAPTDLIGNIPFTEVFPFFNWLVAEVDYARFKPTGATVIVDDGGPVLPDAGWDYPSRDVLTPQAHYYPDGSPMNNPNTGNNLSRTDTGQAFLTEAFQAFLGQTNVIEWGKSTYDNVDTDNPPEGNFPGPEDVDLNGNGWFDTSNGGISGMVVYATTRAENDPRYAAAEPWEPGIPRVQVALYADLDEDTYIDDLNNDGQIVLCDVDNYPFDWTEPMEGQPAVRGDEDVDWNGDGVFDLGDAMNFTHTDSWDDSLPTNCQGPPFVLHGQATDCYDGLRNFNQVQPGVYDGGYIFMTPTPDTSKGIPEGTYIVEVSPPPGYTLMKEEDKNVDFGDSYLPVVAKGDALDIYPPSVGDARVVPEELSLFPGVPCEFGGQTRRLPDRKQVRLSRGQNAPCNFFLFTEAPAAGHIVGFILNDLANEFDPNSPMFGEKYAPPWLPVSIRDWEGREVARIYSDEYGAYNALVPSTYTMNAPMPSGVAPKMMTVVLNSPGPILDEDPSSPTYGQYITDPYFNRKYSQYAYTFQYNPGKTTYLDTPVLPIAAFANTDVFPLDSDFPDGTPVIWSVENGPYITSPGQEIVIVSAGQVEVSNPLYDGSGGTVPRTVIRDYSFGSTQGTVTVGGVPLTDVVWTADSIRGTVPMNAATGELIITRGDNDKSTPVGLTMTVGPIAGAVHQVSPSVEAGATPIQDAIDDANPGDLILIAPGQYEECVVMWKPVQLQGWGAFSVTINAVKAPTEKIEALRQKLASLVLNGSVDLLPGQEIGFTGIEPVLLASEEGSGILVLARNAPMASGGFGMEPNARIDGLTVTGSDQGGGIVVNGYAHYLEISNNLVTGNQGFYGGGIRIGHPFLTAEGPGGLDYDHGHNDNVRIHHNLISGNGGLDGVGGGVSLCTGTDYYQVTDNYICGNFTVGSGGGIGHFGKSRDGLIARNTIIFNQSFDQGLSPTGGGIYIGGGSPLAGNTLTPGSGTVTIDSNLIQGNHAGAGDGGGIRLEYVNGQDVADALGMSLPPEDEQIPTNYPSEKYGLHTIIIVNNMIVNNVTGLAGGGISLQDAAWAKIVNNTIAHNDSTATAGLAFAPGSPNQSTPQIAGTVSHDHSQALAQVMATVPELARFAEFSNPLFANNIISQNRSFYFQVNTGQTPPFSLLPDPSAPVFSDLGLVGTANTDIFMPIDCLFTEDGDPGFVSAYYNGDRGQTIQLVEFTTGIQVQPAFDEGGNYIDVSFGPLSLTNSDTGMLFGDYHIRSNSIALEVGTKAALDWVEEIAHDYDGVARSTVVNDAGADQISTAPVREFFVCIADLIWRFFRALVEFVGNIWNAVWGFFVNIFNPPDPPLPPVNHAPAPTATAISTMVNKTSYSRVLPFDPDFADTHTYALTTPPEHGNAVLTVTGIVTYTPEMAYAGNDSIEVTVTDQGGLSGSVTIAIVVAEMPDMRSTIVKLQCPPDTDGIDTDGDGIVDNDNVCLHLGAGDGFVKMADGRLQYMFGFSNLTDVPLEHTFMAGMMAAEFPAPTIAVKEGQNVYLNLTNVGMAMRPDLFDPHTVHFHGFPNASAIFDGMPDASIAINMGATLTYFYQIVEPGTFMYHCHMEAVEHMQMGMLGNLYVTPKQDGTPYEYEGRTYTQFVYNDGDGSTGYDVMYPIQITSFDPDFHDASMNVQPLPFALMEDKYPMLNGRGYPDTANPAALPAPAENGGKPSQIVSTVIHATQGQRILLRLSNLCVTRFYTLASTIPMLVVGHDARLLRSTSGENLYYRTNSLEMGGGESNDVILETAQVEPGTYLLYTTNLNYLSNNNEDFGGMMAEIVIE